jgi:hypothetical protein
MLINSSFKIAVLFFMIVVSLISSSGKAAELLKFNGHVNGRVEGFNKTDVEMFKANPKNAAFYMEEYYHGYQFAEQNIMVTIMFTINNLGTHRGNCRAIMTVADLSSGRLVDEKEYSPKEVKIDDEGFGISVGPHRFSLDGDRYRVVFAGEELKADLTYIILAPSFQHGDGMVIWKGDMVKYTMPIPYAKAKGTLTYNGQTHEVSGYGHSSHDWQILSPLRYMKHFRTFWLYTDEYAVGVIKTSPNAKTGEWVQRLIVAKQGEILFSSHDFKLTEGEYLSVPGGVVPCPRSYAVEAVHGDASIKGEITLSDIQEKTNVLDDFSPLFKTLASVVVKEAWYYRYWADAKFEYIEDGEVKIIEGRGVGLFIDSTEAEKNR